MTNDCNNKFLAKELSLKSATEELRNGTTITPYFIRSSSLCFESRFKQKYRHIRKISAAFVSGQNPWSKWKIKNIIIILIST